MGTLYPERVRFINQATEFNKSVYPAFGSAKMEGMKDNVALETKDYPIMLFDGLCAFCSGAAMFVLKNEKEKQIRFAALQSETGSRLRATYQLPETIDSFLIIRNGKLFSHYQAVVQLALLMGGGWKILGRVLGVVPDFIGKPLYRVSWRMRKVFGSRDECMLPAPEIRHRFI